MRHGWLAVVLGCLLPSPGIAADDPVAFTPEQLSKALQTQLSVDIAHPYVNQAIRVRLQLLAAGVIIGSVRPPLVTADGVDLGAFTLPTQAQFLVEGRPHTLLEFQAVAVPLEPGALTLGPASVTCELVDPRGPLAGAASSIFQEFLGARRLFPVTLTAAPVALDVRPLPDEGRPEGFAGAVGRFTMSVATVPAQAAIGEPVWMTVTIRGGGLVRTAAPVLSDAGRAFLHAAPRVHAGQGLTAFQFSLTPQDAVREAPVVQFSFFDPGQGRYETLTHGPIPLLVRAARPQPRVLILPWWALGALGLAGMASLRRRLGAGSPALRVAVSRCRRARRLLDAGKPDAAYEEVAGAIQQYLDAQFTRRDRPLPKEASVEIAAFLEQGARAAAAPASMAAGELRPLLAAVEALCARLDRHRV